jgi:multidrug resistance efflux pump
MRKRKLLWLVWILAFVIIAKINMDGSQENTAFQGIAESREVIVNSENAVEIRNIHVTPGQSIEKGRLLVELERRELTLRINEISHRLEELRLQGGIDRDCIRSQIVEFQAEQKVIIARADHEINRIQSRSALNKELTKGLTSLVPEEQNDKKRSPVETEIKNLKEEKRLKLSQIQLRINALKKQLSSPEKPVDVRTQSLEKELALLLTEKKKLLVYAQMDAVVGSILCKVGEKVSPFVPILTLYRPSPSFVKAYIHEAVHHRAKVGETVTVVSQSGRRKRVTGKIEGTGSRIVEYPVRLQKRPDLAILGREVEIRLPEGNPFLLGEKVMVYPLKREESRYLAWIKKKVSSWVGLNLFAAEPENSDQKRNVPMDIRRSASLNDIPEIEASGLIYLPDLNRFLLISDETKEMAPVLYLMDPDGVIRSKTRIRGMDTIDDMEAICADALGNIFLACSQSRKKDGTLPDNRKILAKIKRNGTDFEVLKRCCLFDLLKNAAGKNRSAKWARFIKNGDIEIEGMFYHEQDLYLGFKKPLKDGRAVILRIREIKKVMEENRILPDRVDIRWELDLQSDDSKKGAGISDLLFHDNRLYVLFKAGKNDVRAGMLRVFDGEGILMEEYGFENPNPEGIVFCKDPMDAKKENLVITFDGGGKKPSKMVRMGAPK